MTQQQVYLLLLKIGIVSAIVTLGAWVFVYGRLQPWWRDHIGINLVLNVVISIGQLFFLGLAVFFRLSRLDNTFVAWAYTSFTLAITPLFLWRIVMWIRASDKSPHRNDQPDILPDKEEAAHAAQEPPEPGW